MDQQAKGLSAPVNGKLQSQCEVPRELMLCNNLFNQSSSALGLFKLS
jgi:hypothetical protein